MKYNTIDYSDIPEVKKYIKSRELKDALWGMVGLAAVLYFLFWWTLPAWQILLQ